MDIVFRVTGPLDQASIICISLVDRVSYLFQTLINHCIGTVRDASLGRTSLFCDLYAHPPRNKGRTSPGERAFRSRGPESV